MLIEPRHIRPGAPAFLGWCGLFGANTYRIKTRGITRYDRFEANITLPMGAVIIDIPEALPATETQCAQPDVSGVSPVAPIVLAVEVERVEMLAAPVKDDLEDGMEVREGGVAADEESAPDERTDLAQDDTQLIDTRRFRWLTHRLSVAQCAVSLKVSPRYLALSVPNQTFVYRQGERLLMRRWTVDSAGLIHLDPDIEDAQRSTTFTPVPDADDAPGTTAAPTTHATQPRCDACGAYMARQPDASGRTPACSSCGWAVGDSIPTNQPLDWLPPTVPTTAAAKPPMTQARKQYLLDTWGVPPPPNTLDGAIAIQRARGERP